MQRRRIGMNKKDGDEELESESESKSKSESESESSNLWVGSLSSEVTEKDLMDLFSKFGAVDSLTSYSSSRNYAFVLFNRVQDAKSAKQSLQGSLLRGNPIKIEFTKPAKPCKQLWVGGISPSVMKDKLEEEFTKFGKIEEYKFFRDRNAAYIEYAKLEEASHALKTMNGKNIGGDQIRVEFLRSLSSRREQYPEMQDYGGEGRFFMGNMGPSDTPGMPHDQSKRSTGRKGDGQPSNVLWIGYPPALQIDEQMLHNSMILFGEIEKITNFPSRHYSFVEFRSVDEARRAKEGLQGRLFNDPRITIMFSSSTLAPGKGPFKPSSQGSDAFGHNMPRVPNSFLGPGILGPMRPVLTGSDINDFQREPKRSRLENDEGTPPLYGGSILGKKNVSPVGGRAAMGRGPPTSMGRNDNDIIWRGTIAKGGTPVCHVRCVPIGKGITSELPGTVNCSARTGLDMLTKHYAEAIGFEIVFFVPDSEEDFASYTEFLRYLGSRNRAGVAKLDDGTTLFLVPPSDFLTYILNVPGPERLYGVVLRLPQQSPPRNESHHVPLQLSQSVGGRHVPEYGLPPWKNEEGFSQMEYNRALKEESEDPSKLPVTHTTMSRPQEYPSSAVTSQAGLTLTPELIATLSSLLPPKSSGHIEISNPTPGPSSIRPLGSSSIPGLVDTRILAHYNQSPQHLGHTPPLYNPPQAQQHIPQQQFQPYQTAVSNSPHHSEQQFQGNTYNMRHQGIINIAMQKQANNSHYEPEVSAQQKGGYGMEAPSRFYGSMDYQHYNKNDSHQIPHGDASTSQPQTMMPPPLDLQFPKQQQQQQQQQLQSGAAAHGVEGGDVDKNERYQSTLQFAASLLLQIQQQQSNNQAGGQGARHQQ